MHATIDVINRLKNETADLHAVAERHPFQAAMIRGSVGRQGYAAYLAQVLIVHRALEDRLASMRTDARVRTIATNGRFRADVIEGDLRALRSDGVAAAPTPGATRLVERIGKADAPELLGMLYVLEGSTNGGRFIAKAVGRSLGLEPGPGLRYLDPYGEEQKGKWEVFKEDFRRASFTPDERDRAIEGAKAMFRGLVEVFDDLQANHTSPVPG